MSRLTLSLLVVASLASAQGPSVTWPDFRGPTHDGRMPEARVPLTWSEKENVRWKTPIAGKGWSTPAVAEGKAWMTTATPDGKRLGALAVDVESGQIVHHLEVFSVDEPEHCNKLNSYASPSPAIEEGRVYVHFGTYGTACIDTSKAEITWSRRDLNCDHQQGPGSSPVIVDDLLVFAVDGMDVQYVVALEKKTGKTRWKTDHPLDLGHLAKDRRKAYGTPILYEHEGKRQLVLTSAEVTVAYTPETGKEIWRVRHRGFSNTSRPVHGDGRLYLNSGFMRPSLIGMRPGKGDITDTHVDWTYGRSVPTMSSPVFVGGRVYLVNDNGTVTCVDGKTGERVWRHRIGGEFSASALHTAGRIYFFDREGRTTVIKPGERYEELATNTLDEGFMASPVVVGNALLLRTKTHLYRIEETKKAE